MADRDVKLSKTLSWILRHGATQVGLQLDPAGFLDVDDILQLPQCRGFTLTDVERVVRSNRKQRFATETTDGRLKIRANQGHTLEVENLDLALIASGSECPTAIHGTRAQLWPQIKSRGLSRMARQHIHMAAGRPNQNGIISGMRTNCDLLIYIDVQRALDAGLKFYRSANGVILCPGDHDGYLSVDYFTKVIRIENGVETEVSI